MYHLSKIFNVSTDRKWISQIQSVFDKIVSEKDWKFDDVVGKGGLLEDVIYDIGHSASKTAGNEFLKQWRRRKYLFAEEDTLAKTLEDDFSFNVLTFAPTFYMEVQNQLTVSLALNGVIDKMQRLSKVTQPAFILSDILKSVGKKKFDSSATTDAVLNILNGMGRSGNVGFCIVLEVQNTDDIDNSLKPKKDRYTHIFKMNPYASDGASVGFVRYRMGKAEVTERLVGFNKEVVYMRPPLTKYYG
jgi:hypothetical protein